jgi:hypothetical protein
MQDTMLEQIEEIANYRAGQKSQVDLKLVRLFTHVAAEIGFEEGKIGINIP